MFADFVVARGCSHRSDRNVDVVNYNNIFIIFVFISIARKRAENYENIKAAIYKAV